MSMDKRETARMVSGLYYARKEAKEIPLRRQKKAPLPP